MSLHGKLQACLKELLSLSSNCYSPWPCMVLYFNDWGEAERFLKPSQCQAGDVQSCPICVTDPDLLPFSYMALPSPSFCAYSPRKMTEMPMNLSILEFEMNAGFLAWRGQCHGAHQDEGDRRVFSGQDSEERRRHSACLLQWRSKTSNKGCRSHRWSTCGENHQWANRSCTGIWSGQEGSWEEHPCLWSWWWNIWCLHPHNWWWSLWGEDRFISTNVCPILQHDDATLTQYTKRHCCKALLWSNQATLPIIWWMPLEPWLYLLTSLKAHLF